VVVVNIFTLEKDCTYVSYRTQEQHESKVRTLSNKPEGELVSSNDASCAVVSGLVGDQLAWLDVEDRALVADERVVASRGRSSIAGRRDTEAHGGRLGAAEVASEGGWVSSGTLGQDRLDASGIKEALDGIDGAVMITLALDVAGSHRRNMDFSYTNPKMMVVPLSVTIQASFSITFPSYAMSTHEAHSSSGTTGATLSSPLKRDFSTYPKY
jgi:hypothetical protein